MFYANKIFYNANVITMNPASPKAEAVALWQNKIVGVGYKKDMDTLIGPKTQLINLEGKTLMPGFNDNHSHVLLLGSSLLDVNCSDDNVKSIDDIRNEIHKRVNESKPGEWIRGWGYDDSKLAEGRHPCKEDLDDIAPDNPVIIDRICGHMLAANSYALKLAGICAESIDPPGGCIVRKPNSAEPTGLLQENAQIPVREVFPQYSVEEVAKMVMLGTEIFARNGITSTADASSADALFMVDEAKGWSLAYERNQLKTRVNLLINCVESRKLDVRENLGKFQSDMLRFGAIKYFLDGGIGGATAAMTEPYSSDPSGKNKGILYWEKNELMQMMKADHDSGFQISLHAIGDAAITMILDIFEELYRDNPRVDARHRIEHCTVCTPNMLDRIGAMKILPIMQPAHLYYLGKSHLLHMGKDRIQYEIPLRSMLLKGLPIVLSTDVPVIKIDPFPVIKFAVDRKIMDGVAICPEEGITVSQALWAYTAAGAYATFDERRKGQLIPGMLADLVILSGDPLTMPPEEITSIKVEMSVLDGEIIYIAE